MPCCTTKRCEQTVTKHKMGSKTAEMINLRQPNVQGCTKHETFLINLRSIIVLYLKAFFLCGASAHFWAVTSPISFLQTSLFLAATFQLRIWSKSKVSLQTTRAQLTLIAFSVLLSSPLPKPLPGFGNS